MQKHPTVATNKLTKTSLVAHLARVPDPRINRRKDHDLVDILVIAICTLLCAGETFNDMEDFGKAKHDWFQTLRNCAMAFLHMTPSTVFLPRSNRSIFWNVSLAGRRVCAAAAQEVVALDGKALRRALNGDQASNTCGQRVGGKQRAGAGPVEGGGQEQRNHRRAGIASKYWSWEPVAS